MKTKYDYSAVIEHVINYNLLGFLAFIFLLISGFVFTCILFLVFVGMFGWYGALFVGSAVSIGIITFLVKREIKERGRLYEKH